VCVSLECAASLPQFVFDPIGRGGSAPPLSILLRYLK
jgi:hypothetical protein